MIEFDILIYSFSGRRYVKWDPTDTETIENYFENVIQSVGEGNQGSLPGIFLWKLSWIIERAVIW